MLWFASRFQHLVVAQFAILAVMPKPEFVFWVPVAEPIRLNELHLLAAVVDIPRAFLGEAAGSMAHQLVAHSSVADEADGVAMEFFGDLVVRADFPPVMVNAHL